ncbi:thiamine diphosphokinase [Mycoplasma sp. SG1]|uniref:thiamine diphosphokinase n=1 Tax=Mycoplasma sp. SG1 TaxID=2810348 RepID=UPI002025A484|nr:thiamine diphosphokinase [Mycoplasma sp. SG1]URM53048.1 thiamine diphosphokinase [Mycoplasma sp. SG1]
MLLKKVAIISSVPNDNFKNNFKDYHFIGVEKGAKYLIDQKFENLVYFVSDCDSINENDKLLIQNHFQAYAFLDSNKNETDIELAIIWAIKNDYQEIVIFQSGNRQDHFFCNLLIIRKYTNDYPKIKIKLLDNFNSIYYLPNNTKQIFTPQKSAFISFFSLEQSIISTTNLKWNLTNKKIDSNSTFTISNQIDKSNNFIVNVIKGGIFVFLSIDD